MVRLCMSSVLAILFPSENLIPEATSLKIQHAVWTLCDAQMTQWQQRMNATTRKFAWSLDQM